MTTTISNTKNSEVENKVSDNSKYITTQKFNKLTAEDFAVRLKQADLVNKTDFEYQLIALIDPLLQIKQTKHLAVLKKVNSLIIKE